MPAQSPRVGGSRRRADLDPSPAVQAWEHYLSGLEARSLMLCHTETCLIVHGRAADGRVERLVDELADALAALVAAPSRHHKQLERLVFAGQQEQAVELARALSDREE
jgi:hypothetical protein